MTDVVYLSIIRCYYKTRGGGRMPAQKGIKIIAKNRSAFHNGATGGC